jgi:hypothetical protein
MSDFKGELACINLAAVSFLLSLTAPEIDMRSLCLTIQSNQEYFITSFSRARIAHQHITIMVFDCCRTLLHDTSKSVLLVIDNFLDMSKE